MLDALRARGRHPARPWTQTPAAALGLAVATALVVGVLAAALPSPAPIALALVGAAGLGAILRRPVLGVFAFVGVVVTLPFGVIPVRLGVQLTFVDAVLILTYLGLLTRVPALLGTPGGLRLTRTGGLLLAFIGVSALAFIVGLGLVPGSAESVRRFGKLVASLGFFLVVLSLVRDRLTLERLLRAMMVGGAFAGAVGAALWRLPPPTQERLLRALSVVGYPTDNVLRYVPGENATYTTQLRAVGTAVDPNVFGGTMMLAAALIALQLVARDRVFSRPVLLLLAVPTLAGLVASLSRGSWLGLVAGVAVVGALRYRAALVWLALGVLAVLALPQGQALVERFVGGLTTADPATALRLGEYRNAITLIQLYPFLGIGFGPSPDADVTAGVSSVYLLVGEQVGVFGLLVYMLLLGSVWVVGARALLTTQDGRLRGILAGLLAAYSAALVAGLLDHYFANQVFPHAVAWFWLHAACIVVAARLAAGPAPGAGSSRA